MQFFIGNAASICEKNKSWSTVEKYCHLDDEWSEMIMWISEHTSTITIFVFHYMNSSVNEKCLNHDENFRYGKQKKATQI